MFQVVVTSVLAGDGEAEANGKREEKDQNYPQHRLPISRSTMASCCQRRPTVDLRVIMRFPEPTEAISTNAWYPIEGKAV